MTTSFRARLRAGERLCGTLLTLGSVEVAEILSGLGFDWLFLDAEHGALESRDVLQLLQAIGGRTPCLVRIPALEEGWVKRVLDAGAEGIIVPQVETAAQAERAVRYAHFPPVGTRGLGTGRANRYGLGLSGFLADSEARVTVVIQAETRSAVEQIEDLVRVPGVDAVFVGPYDLSASLGFPGEVDHPQVREAIGRVAAACGAARLPAGVFALSPEGLPGSGFSLLASGVDGVLLGRAAAVVLEGMRRRS
jgi:2-keto-3-deoxy-L-rhamnonate aldolase RhmA